jgi:hypothetical protein
MAVSLNIDFQTGYAKNSSNSAGWWSGNKRRLKGVEYARKLMNQWGIGYGDNGLETIPYSLVRIKDSEYYIPCEDIENILRQSRTKYDDAYRRFESCGSFSKKCKGRAVIDKAKWQYITDWAKGATVAQSEINNYNTCDEEEVELAIQNVLDYAETILGEKESKFGYLDNKAVGALCAVGGITLALILIKSTK